MGRAPYCLAMFAMLTAGSAAATTWQFSYQGFYNSQTSGWDPSQRLTGSFTGNDDNSDGLIARDEISQFFVGGFELLADPECPNPGIGLRCSVEMFSYRPTGVLNFTARWGYSDEMFGTFAYWAAGNRIIYSGYSPRDQYTRTLYWTPRTAFTISPPPIPEPCMPAMVAAGALVLAARRWHGSRRNRT